MHDDHDPISTAWENADLWMHNYRHAHPEDDREDLDIYLDGTVYHQDSPYWPLRDCTGTLIDFNHPVVEVPYAQS